jgi:hypothetical protein
VIVQAAPEVAARPAPSSIAGEVGGRDVRVFKLFGFEDAVLAALIGGLFAGAAVLSLNYMALGRRIASHVSLLIGGTVSLLFVGVCLVLFPYYALVMFLLLNPAFAYAIYHLARLHQEHAFVQHQLHGGSKASTVWAVAIGFVCLAGWLVLFAMVMPQ